MANYVTLVNQLLIRLNEVTLDPGGDGFGSVRGPQALAKDAINNSLRHIFQHSEEWPFLKNTYTQTLTAGTTLYNFPADFAEADFDTFYLKKSETYNNSPRALRPMMFEDYIQNHRAIDDEAGAQGRGVPLYVYTTYNNSFGVTPSPDNPYEVEYVYWSFPADLTLYNDTTVVPDRFNHVIIDGAMMYMMRFRSNDQSAEIHQRNFEQGLRTMRRILLQEPMYVRSTVIQKVPPYAG